MDPNTVYVLESRLISMDGATQIRISEFEERRWHNSRVCALSGLYILKLPTGQILRLGKYLRLLTHKLRPDCNWGETAPLLCLSFSTWAGLEHLMDPYAGTPQPYGQPTVLQVQAHLPGRLFVQKGSIASA